jgi:uncharacterized protein YifE (UPF0438 family)
MEKSTPTQQTVACGPNDEYLSRKQKKQVFSKLGDFRRNADEMMKEYNKTMEEQEVVQQTSIKMEESTSMGMETFNGK